MSDLWNERKKEKGASFIIIIIIRK